MIVNLDGCWRAHWEMRSTDESQVEIAVRTSVCKSLDGRR
jgi:hypothetical protein